MPRSLGRVLAVVVVVERWPVMSDAAPPPSETEVKLARALLAWKRLADRGFGPPDKWEAYEWHGFKLDMAGSEEWFDDLFEAEAVKAACVAADGLPERILDARPR